MSYTPQTDKLYDARHETDILSAYYLMRDLAKRLEIERNDACHSWRMSSVCRKLAEERDEWKQKYIQQNKDLGCEMMDPNGTIWDYAKKIQKQLDAVIEERNEALSELKRRDVVRDFSPAQEYIAAIQSGNKKVASEIFEKYKDTIFSKP